VTNFAGNEVKISVDYSNYHSMRVFARNVTRKNAGRTRDVDVVPLYCAMIPAAVWRDSGGLDETYEMGMFEDDDFSLRLRNAGYRTVAAEDCFVHHFGQGSFAALPPEQYQKIFNDNRARFERKWGVDWRPHRQREGVLDPGAEPRFSPETFY
jgi:GT2 family glycosyltransferase